MSDCKVCKGKGFVDHGGYDGHRFDHDWKPCTSCKPKPVELGHVHKMVESDGYMKCTVCKKKWVEVS